MTTDPRPPMPPPIPPSRDRLSGGFALEPMVLFAAIVVLLLVGTR